MPQEVVDMGKASDVESKTTHAVYQIVDNDQGHVFGEPAQAVGHFEVQCRGNPIRYAHR